MASSHLIPVSVEDYFLISVKFQLAVERPSFARDGGSWSSCWDPKLVWGGTLSLRWGHSKHLCTPFAHEERMFWFHWHYLLKKVLLGLQQGYWDPKPTLSRVKVIGVNEAMSSRHANSTSLYLISCKSLSGRHDLACRVEMWFLGIETIFEGTFNDLPHRGFFSDWAIIHQFGQALQICQWDLTL